MGPDGNRRLSGHRGMGPEPIGEQLVGAQSIQLLVALLGLHASVAARDRKAMSSRSWHPAVSSVFRPSGCVDQRWYGSTLQRRVREAEAWLIVNISLRQA